MAYVRIMESYGRELSGRVRRREITQATRTIKLNQASRVFEACLRALSPRALEVLTNDVFGTSFTDTDERGYLQVVLELKAHLGIPDQHLATTE
jgi:hypothetical protein